MLFAGSLAGAASAQERIGAPQAAAPACASPNYCGPRSFGSFWQRSTSRLEMRLGYDLPDPVPAGTSLYQTMPVMIDNGIAVRMILHDYDFLPGKAELNPRGKETLRQVAAWALRHPYPVIVEKSNYDEKLAEQRKLAALAELKVAGIPLPADRVITGFPRVRGVHGVEADPIFQNLLLQTQSRGLTGGGGASAGGGASSSTGASATSGTSTGAAAGTTGTIR